MPVAAEGSCWSSLWEQCFSPRCKGHSFSTKVDNYRLLSLVYCVDKLLNERMLRVGHRATTLKFKSNALQPSSDWTGLTASIRYYFGTNIWRWRYLQCKALITYPDIPPAIALLSGLTSDLTALAASWMPAQWRQALHLSISAAHFARVIISFEHIQDGDLLMDQIWPEKVTAHMEQLRAVAAAHCSFGPPFLMANIHPPTLPAPPA